MVLLASVATAFGLMTNRRSQFTEHCLPKKFFENTRCLFLCIGGACRILAMPAACAHAGHVGTPAAFGVWRVMVWNAMVFE